MAKSKSKPAKEVKKLPKAKKGGKK